MLRVKILKQRSRSELSTYVLSRHSHTFLKAAGAGSIYWYRNESDSRAVKKKFLIILAALLLLLALCIVVIGPVALIFPAYILFGAFFYVVDPLISHPMVLVGSLMACILGGHLLSRWPVAQLRYAAVPAAAMGAHYRMVATTGLRV